MNVNVLLGLADLTLLACITIYSMALGIEGFWRKINYTHKRIHQKEWRGFQYLLYYFICCRANSSHLANRLFQKQHRLPPAHYQHFRSGGNDDSIVTKVYSGNKKKIRSGNKGSNRRCQPNNGRIRRDDKQLYWYYTAFKGEGIREKLGVFYYYWSLSGLLYSIAYLPFLIFLILLNPLYW